MSRKKNKGPNQNAPREEKRNASPAEEKKNENSVKETAEPAEDIKETAETAEPEQETTQPAEPEQETAEVAEPEEKTAETAEPEEKTAETAEPEEETAEAAEPEEETAETAEPEEETAETAEPEQETAETAEPEEETAETAEPEEETAETAEPEEKTANATAEKSPEPAKKSKKERTPLEEQERALNRVKRRKKLKYGSLATVITVVFIAIVVFANVICNMLDSRYNWNIDLTSNGLYEIDEQTINYLHQLNTDVEIGVMAEERYFLDNAKLKIVSETLNRFKAESNGHISVEYINLTTDPEKARKYSELYSSDLQQADIAVKAGDLVRVVPFDDIIATESGIDYATYTQTYNYTFKGEQSLVSAIMGVTDLNPMKAAVIDTMNGQPIYDAEMEQYSAARIQELLEKNNYQPTSVDIVSDELSPEEYDLAVLIAPSNDFTEAQITKLNDFLANGGKYSRQLIYFAPTNQKDTPNLNDFLAVWGIQVGDSWLYESDNASAQYVSTAAGTLSVPAAVVSDSELNGTAASSRLPIVLPLVRPLELLFESGSGRTTEALLSSSETSFVIPFDENNENFDVSAAEKRSYVAAAVGTQYFTENNETMTSNVVVFGSAWMLDYYVASSSSYQNADYFVSLVNHLTGRENVITIAEKSLDNTQITVTDSQIKAIRTVTVVVIPLIVAAIGVLVYIRRKNR